MKNPSSELPTPSTPAPVAASPTSSQGQGVDLKRLLSLVRPHLKPLTAAFIALVIGTGMTLIYPAVIGRLIDEVIDGGELARLDNMILILVGVFAVQAIFAFGRAYLFTMVGERVVTDLRSQLYDSLSTQEIAFFDERRTGALISRLSSDTGVLQNTVTANLSMAFRFGLQVLGGIAILIYTSPKLTGVMLAVVPLVVAAAVVFGRRVKILSKRVQDALANASEVADETLGGIRTVRSFAREKAERLRYKHAVEDSYDQALQRTRVVAVFGAVISFSGYSSVAAVLWFGGRLVVSGELSVGTLTSFVVYTLMVAFALGALSNLHADFMRAIGASTRVFELIDRRPTIAAPPNPQRPDPVRGALGFHAVQFAYPSRSDHPVLRGFSLEIAPGEQVALVGPSGAGKSTVASLLPRFYDPQSGHITLDGCDLRALDPDWLRTQIGAVSQEPVLFATTIAENIGYGAVEASREAIEAAAKAANAHDFVMAFPEGYETRVGERGVMLSGGQKQRVAIARALLKDPKVLILDEATSALDAESEHLVQGALERLMAGRTTLIIAHRLSTVRNADRVVVLDGGQIVQTGAHDTLVEEEGLYRRLVRRQFADGGAIAEPPELPPDAPDARVEDLIEGGEHSEASA